MSFLSTFQAHHPRLGHYDVISRVQAQPVPKCWVLRICSSRRVQSIGITQHSVTPWPICIGMTSSGPSCHCRAQGPYNSTPLLRLGLSSVQQETRNQMKRKNPDATAPFSPEARPGPISFLHVIAPFLLCKYLGVVVPVK